jgi:hypothetical protein
MRQFVTCVPSLLQAVLQSRAAAVLPVDPGGASKLPQGKVSNASSWLLNPCCSILTAVATNVSLSYLTYTSWAPAVLGASSTGGWLIRFGVIASGTRCSQSQGGSEVVQTHKLLGVMGCSVFRIWQRSVPCRYQQHAHASWVGIGGNHCGVVLHFACRRQLLLCREHPRQRGCRTDQPIRITYHTLIRLRC